MTVTEYRPGPHAGSLSFTANATALHVELSMLMASLSGAYVREPVPSKSDGPKGELEGEGEREMLCVCEDVCV